jgi:antagonist of KipI
VTILVESSGLLSSLQDLGRPGYQHLGVGPGGAMDDLSHRLVSLLVGNPPELPSLEITLVGPVLLFEEDALVALGGADLSAEADGLPVPLWRPVMVRAGARLRFGKPLEGCRSYLAVAGGFKVPPVLGGSGTHLAAGFGGFHGRALRPGDRLAAAPPPPELYPGLQRLFASETRPIVSLGWFVPWFREQDCRRPTELGFIPGPQWLLLRPEHRGPFLDGTYRVASESDRMGLRLRGPRGQAPTLERKVDLVSAGVTAGTLQLPPDGVPILLMADRQTTGGYPRLGEVAGVDLCRAAQLRPGEPVRFRPATVDEAQDRWLRREEWLRGLAEQVAERMLK